MKTKISAPVLSVCLVLSLAGGIAFAETFNPTSGSVSRSCASIGTPVTIAVNANRSSGVYYRYIIQNAGQQPLSLMSDDWTPDNTTVWIPETGGKKEVSVQMKDDVTSLNWRGIVEFTYEVGASDCVDPIAISVNPTTGRVNEPVTITATGSQDNLYYQFWYTPGLQNPFGGGESVMIRDWAQSNRTLWTPPNQDWFTLEVRTAHAPGSSNVGKAKISYKVDVAGGKGGPPVISNPLANPNQVPSNGTSSTWLTALVTDPDHDLLSVLVDLSSLGGSSQQVMRDDGAHGDGAAGDGIYGISATAPVSTPVGQKALLITAHDGAGNSSSNYFTLSVVQEIRDSIEPQGRRSYSVVNNVVGQTLSFRYVLVVRSKETSRHGRACNPTITVIQPNGTVYGTETMGTSPGTISVPNAQAGTYTCEVTNECSTGTSYEIIAGGGGVGVVTGTVKDAATSRGLSGAIVQSDTGGTALSLSGYYVMVNAAGVFTVTAASLSYQVSSIPSTVLNAGGSVTVDFSLTPVGANARSIIINSSTSPGVGTPLSIRFDSRGNTSPLYYRYWQANGYQTPQYGNWQVLSGWGTGDTLTWSPPAKDHYVIVAYVTNDVNSGGFQQVGLSVETQGNTANPIMISELETDLGFPQPKGTAVHLTTTASGGAQALYYRYWQKKEPGGAWTIVRDYSLDPSSVWVPVEAGTYIVVVWVTDDLSAAEPPIAGMTCTIAE